MKMPFTPLDQITRRSIPLLLQAHAVTTSAGFMVPCALQGTRGAACRDTVVHEVLKRSESKGKNKQKGQTI